jgi:uncharacterized protein YecE (DUF72 family)
MSSRMCFSYGRILPHKRKGHRVESLTNLNLDSCLCVLGAYAVKIWFDFHPFFTYYLNMILVGTSGFQYRDWVPVFYPGSLDLGDWLAYYSRRFSCCELGFTCYRMPEPFQIQQLIDGSGGALQFVFRVPSRLCERPFGKENPAREFVSSLWPLKEAGQLGAVVARFDPGFTFIRDNFDFLCRLQESLDGVPLVAEFGCPDWLTPRAVKHLSARRLGLACVDGGISLSEPTFYCATADVAYVRFQGRKHSRWVQGDGSEQHDYLYSRAELAAAVPHIRRLSERCERVFVLMNNPWRGQSAVNARMLLELLGGDGTDQ